MRNNRPIILSLAALVFLLAGVAVFKHANQGISALLFGWRTALSFDQSIDMSKLDVKFGVFDMAHKFADSSRMAFEHIFVSWLDDNHVRIESTSSYAAERDRWVMITIEPYAREEGVNTVDTLFADIRAGAYDIEIERICSVLADQGRPVFIRWGHEMDVVTGRYHWAQHNASGYMESYRYFVSRCRSIVPDSWYVWSPISTGPQVHRYWPGGEYVDRIGLPVFGFAERDLELFGYIRSFSDILDDKYQRVSIYQKQIMIAELGVAGDAHYQRQWIMQLLRNIDDYPLVTSLVYFNSRDKEGAWEGQYSVPDWRIDSGVLD